MDLASKVQQLCEEVTTMRNEITEIKEQSVQQNNTIMTLLQNQNTLILKLLGESEKATKAASLPRLPRFPIQTQTDLDDVENWLNDTNKEELVSYLKPLLMPLGLKKNLKYVLSTEIVINYNVDGSHGKSRLLLYPKLLHVLFRATEREGWSYRLFMDDVRMGLQYAKKRHFKTKSMLNKKTGPSISSGIKRESTRLTQNPLNSDDHDDDDDDESSSD